MDTQNNTKRQKPTKPPKPSRLLKSSTLSPTHSPLDVCVGLSRQTSLADQNILTNTPTFYVQDVNKTKIDVQGGDFSRANLGDQSITNNTVNHYSYDGGQQPAEYVLPKGTFGLSPRILVHEDNPINAESRIYRAVIKSKITEDQDIAIKILPENKYGKREASMHFRIPPHRNIVHSIFADTFKYHGQSCIYLALEYCDPLNLYEFMKLLKNECCPFPASLFISYALQITEAVAFLHAHGVINRDLKPQNVLLTPNKMVPKLCDFGFSKAITEDTTELSRAQAGTSGWMSPEVLRGDLKISKSADVFSLGLIEYFLLSYGEHAFGAGTNIVSRNHYILYNQNLRLDSVHVLNPDAIRNIIIRMLNPDPTDRPSADQVLEDLKQIFPDSATPTINDGTIVLVGDATFEETSLDQAINDGTTVLVSDAIIEETSLDQAINDGTTVLVGDATTEETSLDQSIQVLNSLRKDSVTQASNNDKTNCEALQATSCQASTSITEFSSEIGQLSNLERCENRSSGRTFTFGCLPQMFKKKGNESTKKTHVTPSPSNLHKIKREDISIEKRVISNYYSYGKWRQNDVDLIIMVKQEKNNCPIDENLLHEAKILNILQHENVIKLHGLVSQSPVWLIMENMSNGSLRDYTLKGPGKICSHSVLTGFALQVATGMAHVVSRDYLHRDINADNVFVDHNKICKIGGFHLSEKMKDGHYFPVVGFATYAVKWASTEVLRSGDYTEKSDIWSFGVLLFEIFTRGKKPYADLSNKEAKARVIEGERLARPPCATTTMYQLMLECWDDDPEKRPTFENIMKQLKKML